MGHVLAYLIAGHHAGLGDWYSKETGRAAVSARLESGRSEYEHACRAGIPKDILDHPPPQQALNPDGKCGGFHLWLRMLFSALVDADFLDTEAFMDEARPANRQGWPGLPDLSARLSLYLARFKADTLVNLVRAQILAECRAAARQPPGIFSLTVPTGGGKTLSSLAFTLDHALRHDKQRVIYAIPYTSIIEQTADVFRAALGEEAVLEHHSNLEPDPQHENHRSRLAAENWDAPLIVTTNVQLFESLFASRTSRCRKLHNLVNSVIVLDEAQQLPRDFLTPISDTVRLLAEHYGVSWVLCTATQPNLAGQKDAFGRTTFGGLPRVREIIADPAGLADRLKRVDVHLPQRRAQRRPWAELADEIASESCVLVVVNTRQDCRTLFRALPKDGSGIHLSALMCPQHRSEVIRHIRERLEKRRQGDSRPLRVVSTQLVEAGVDLDFPLVYRALAGLDSIAQAAGRCNREGRLPRPGKVIVFEPEREAPPGLLRQGASITRELRDDIAVDPLAPSVFERYFEHLYAKGSTDSEGIAKLLTPSGSGDAPFDVQFRTAAERFRLIKDHQLTVVVPYRSPGQAKSPVDTLLGKLERDGNHRWIHRMLQRYVVGLPQKLAERMMVQGGIQPIAGQHVLLESLYDRDLGVILPEEAISSEYMIV
ncbi:MAG TPA: CRISPR-associated helicase Cas3', partial [Acidobacteriaceae bacterium]|nr:CRISPR-associated helicase Cas3' [Acidobacteriaceae bacterium]